MRSHTSIFSTQAEAEKYLKSLLSRPAPILTETAKKLLASLLEERKTSNIPNVSDSTGSFLYHLVRETESKHILELGTANGYSSIYLLEAILENEKVQSAKSTESGYLLTIERLRDNFNLAKKNLASYKEHVTLVRSDASDFLKSASDMQFDFIFIDALKSATLKHFLLARKLLRPGGIIVVDDVAKFAFKMQDFHDFIEQEKPLHQIVMTDPDDGVMVLWNCEI